MVEQLNQRAEILSTFTFNNGTEVTYYTDGGLVVRASPNHPDPLVGGKRFARWSDGNYVEICPKNSPTVIVIICEPGKDARVEVRPNEEINR